MFEADKNVSVKGMDKHFSVQTVPGKGPAPLHPKYAD